VSLECLCTTHMGFNSYLIVELRYFATGNAELCGSRMLPHLTVRLSTSIRVKYIVPLESPQYQQLKG
jgi:hypothetical protein